MSIIDFHTHIGGFIIPNIKGVYEVRAEHLIEYMDEVGVEKAVLLSVGECWRNYEKLRGLTNELTLKAASKYPNRIIPFMAVDP